MIEVGDTVFRMLAGVVEMKLKVTEVSEDKIVCEMWEFDPKTGAEIDEELGWGPNFGQTGSFLRMKDGQIEVEKRHGRDGI